MSDEKIENQYYFTDRVLKVAYVIIIYIHQSKNANSVITFVSKHDSFGIDINHILKISKEMANKYAELIKQYKFKYQLSFLVLLNKEREDNETNKITY